MSALATQMYQANTCQIESTPRLRLFVETTAATDGILASDTLDSKNWNSVLRALNDWAAQPTMFEADDFSPPSSIAIVRASKVAEALQSQNFDLPMRVIPSADEGVAFEWKYDGGYRTIEVRADGSVEVLDYFRGQLRRRFLDI
jgi:hypothetical protein